jgi:hypothetical protein
MTRFSAWAFFNLGPAPSFPPHNRGLVTFQCPPGRPLTTPSQLPKNAPDVSRVILDPALLLDQMRHARRSPQPRVISQTLRPTLQATLDPFDIFCAEAGLASGPSGLLQPGSTFRLQLLCPATHRLPMHARLARYFGLMHSLFQQPGSSQTSLLQRGKVSPYSCRVSHSRTIAWNPKNVTILCDPQ